jgi:hypothetical protein
VNIVVKQFINPITFSTTATAVDTSPNTPDETIHAYGKTSVSGDLEALGTNNYNTFYDSKTGYKSN